MLPTLEGIQKAAWRTASARYNAARRLRRREHFATVSFALISALTIAVAFAQKVYAKPGSPADDYLATMSVAAGAILLAQSLIEWGARTGATAESLHQNAEKLNAYWRRLALFIADAKSKSALPISLQDGQSYLDEYAKIKADCPYNHDPLDDQYFTRDHSDFGHKNGLASFFIWAKWQLSSLWYIALFWIVLVCLALPLNSQDAWKVPPTVVLQTQTK